MVQAVQNPQLDKALLCMLGMNQWWLSSQYQRVIHTAHWSRSMYDKLKYWRLERDSLVPKYVSLTQRLCTDVTAHMDNTSCIHRQPHIAVPSIALDVSSAPEHGQQKSMSRGMFTNTYKSEYMYVSLQHSMKFYPQVCHLFRSFPTCKYDCETEYIDNHHTLRSQQLKAKSVNSTGELTEWWRNHHRVRIKQTKRYKWNEIF